MRPLRAGNERTVANAEGGLEMIEEFGNALLTKCLGSPDRRILLIVEIQAACNRMVHIVHLGHHVGNGQLQLDQMKVLSAVASAQTVAIGQPGDDMGDLRDPKPALPFDQIGRRIRCKFI